jgi:predicted RNase H-like HicB family nuclease
MTAVNGLGEGLMAHYFGILDGGDGVWGVRVPDLPGCHRGGHTASAAREKIFSGAGMG